MISLIELILREAKQVGPLFHFTSYSYALGIVKDNFRFDAKLSSEYTEDEGYISFTRNKTLKSSTIEQNQVRFKLDGDKLSTKYKITPYADFYSDYGRNQDGGDESEERINTAKHKWGIDFKNYLLSFDIVGYKGNDYSLGSYYKDLTAHLDDNNIKYNIVNKF